MIVYIKTTESCNLACKHCFIGDKRQEHEFFNPELTTYWLAKYIEENKIDPSTLAIMFHGGEPFLCDIEKLMIVSEAFPEAEFTATTNLCYTLTEEIIDYITSTFYSQKLRKPLIKTSWDYQIRFNTKEQEALWEKNVKRLLDEDVEVRVITCLTKPFIENVTPEEYVDKMSKLGITYTSFERLRPSTTDDKTLIPRYEDVDEWLCRLYKINDKIKVGLFEEIELALEGNFVSCRSRNCMKYKLTINANGTIGGCSNISNHHYYMSINGEEDLAYKEKLTKEEEVKNVRCYTCEHYSVCNGECWQLEWQGDTCPMPIKLLGLIKKDKENGKSPVDFKKGVYDGINSESYQQM